MIKRSWWRRLLGMDIRGVKATDDAIETICPMCLMSCWTKKKDLAAEAVKSGLKEFNGRKCWSCGYSLTNMILSSMYCIHLVKTFSTRQPTAPAIVEQILVEGK